MLFICCWAWGWLLSVVCIPRETPLEKTVLACVCLFCLWTVVKLQIALVRDKSCVHFPSISGMPCVLDLCRPCACCHSLWAPMCISPVGEKTLFLWSLPSQLAVTILLPSFLQSSLSPEFWVHFLLHFHFILALQICLCRLLCCKFETKCSDVN